MSDYTRRVTIYINDKEVENNIKSIKNEMYKLTAQQAKMTIGSKEYIKTGQEIKKLDRIYQNHRNTIKSNTNSIVNLLKNYALGFLGVTTAINAVIGATREAIQTNRTFESTFGNVLTLLDETQKKQYRNFLEQGAIDIVADYGFAIEDVNQALFDLISNGIPAGESIDFLRKNAVLAIGGVSNLSSTVKATTKIMNTYKDEAGDVTDVTSALFAAQVKGATTVELLSDNVGKLASISAQSKIPMNEMLVTFAGLTKQLDGTEESATALRQVMASVIKPSKEARKIYTQLGISVGQSALQQDGLLNKLLEVAAAADGNQDILSELIPNIRAFSGVSSLSAETIAELEQNIEDLNDKEKSAALLQAAFNEKIQEGEIQSKKLKGEWQRLIINVGGGESIFKKIGRAVRMELTEKIQNANKAVTILSEGSWVNRLKLVLNTTLRYIAQFFNPILGLTGKKIEFKIELPVKEQQEFIKSDKEVTKELTKEEEERQKKLEAIRKAAAQLAEEEEKEKAEKLKKIQERVLNEIERMEEEYHLKSLSKLDAEIEKIKLKYDKLIEKAGEAQIKQNEIDELRFMKSTEIADKIAEQKENEADEILKEIEKKQDEEYDITQKNIQREIDAYNKKNIELAEQREEDFEEEKKKMEDLKKLASDYAIYVGSLLNQALEDGKLTLDEMLRVMTLSLLKGLKQILNAAMTKVWLESLSTPESIATLGAAGAMRAGIMVGLLEAAFAGIEQTLMSGLNQRVRGKYTVTGADDGRTYRNIPFTQVTQSGILNAGRPTLINEHGGEYILTASHVQNLQINYPEILRAIHATRIPQRAEGNYSTQVPATQQSIPYNQIIAVLAENTRAIRNLQTKGITGKWYLNELQDAESELNDIENIASGG